MRDAVKGNYGLKMPVVSFYFEQEDMGIGFLNLISRIR